MSKLNDEIAAFDAQKAEAVPGDILAILNKGTEDLKATGIDDRAVKDGAKAPSFTLNNHLGEPRSLDSLLAKGPVVLNFYRGGW